MKGKFYFSHFRFGHSHFVFIPLGQVKYFPPICYFLLNFLLDFFFFFNVRSQHFALLPQGLG